MNLFSEYTTDELFDLYAHIESSFYRNEVSFEIERRQIFRNAWLDHCNAVAGEVIA